MALQLRSFGALLVDNDDVPTFLAYAKGKAK
jgi:hypothetical protein